jgi:hypothetical protein
MVRLSTGQVDAGQNLLAVLVQRVVNLLDSVLATVCGIDQLVHPVAVPCAISALRQRVAIL